MSIYRRAQSRAGFLGVRIVDRYRRARHLDCTVAASSAGSTRSRSAYAMH